MKELVKLGSLRSYRSSYQSSKSKISGEGQWPFLHSFYSAILHVPQRVSGILQQSDITEFVHVIHLGREKHMFITKKNVNNDSPSFLGQHNFT